MLTFHNVSLKINSHSVLERINFDISPGELVAILGTSGAGKSSVFNLLIGDKKPSSGAIMLDDIKLNAISYNNLQRYRQQIGIIFQDFRLLPEKTVFENIAFALEVCGQEELIAQKVPELIKLVKLSGKEKSFPKELSGGECQRVAIARALVHDPKILIADEPTGNLDPRNSFEIADLLLQLNREKGLTILFATHDPILIKRLHPRLMLLENGKLTVDSPVFDESILRRLY